MHLLITVLILFGFKFGYCQSDNGFLITGKIKGIPKNTKLYLLHEKNGEADTVAISQVKNGVFQFSGSLKLGGEFYWIRPDTTISKGAPLSLLLINSKINIEGVVNDWPNNIRILGSPPHDDYIKFRNLLSKPKADFKNLGAQLDSLYKSINYSITELDSMQKKRYFEIKAKLIKQSNIIEKEYNQTMISFVFNNPKSLYTPLLIKKIAGLLTEDSLFAAYNNLSSESKSSYYGAELGFTLNNKKRLKIGNSILDFSITTVNGTNSSIIAFLKKGKITLIDFWASWCKPCREATPKIRDVYERFHSKGFNVLGISLDKDRNAWIKAIKEDNMPWDHGISDKAQKVFDVTAIPAYVLLDSTGKILSYHIVMSNVASGQNEFFMEEDKLEKMLGALLNE